MGFSGKISSSFLRQSAVVQIVLVNAVVFVIVHIAALFGIGYAGEWLMLPQSWTEVMSTPWTLLTYMFAHFDFLHILGNMLCLYCFGIVALDLMTPRRFVATYIAGGLAGAAAYLSRRNCAIAGTYRIFGGGHGGGGAAVLTKPDYHVRLWLFGLVKINGLPCFMWLSHCLQPVPTLRRYARTRLTCGILAGAVVALDCAKKYSPDGARRSCCHRCTQSLSTVSTKTGSTFCSTR